MKTLDRYIAGIFIKNFALGVVALTSLFVFQALLGDMIGHEYAPSTVLIYHLLSIPQVVVQMMPPAVLLATVMTLSGLARTSELMACHAIGIGVRRIGTLLLSVVFILSCMVLILEDRILPPTFKKRTTWYWREMKGRQDFYIDIKQDKIWYRSKNLIYNLQRFDPKENSIHGMSVYTFDDQFNLLQVVDAAKADYTPQGWKLKKGTVTVFNKTDPFPLTQGFEGKELLIAETPSDFQEIEKEVDSLRLKELYRYIQRIKAAGADTKSYEVKFHSKISLAFIPVVMCILGIPFSTRGRREGSIAKDLGLVLAITFVYWLFYSVGLSLGSAGTVPPMLAAWLPSMVFVALAGGMIARRG